MKLGNWPTSESLIMNMVLTLPVSLECLLETWWTHWCLWQPDRMTTCGGGVSKGKYSFSSCALGSVIVFLSVYLSSSSISLFFLSFFPSIYTCFSLPLYKLLWIPDQMIICKSKHWRYCLIIHTSYTHNFLYLSPICLLGFSISA